MKSLSTLRWLLRTAFVLVVGLLLLRALLEFVPALQAAPLFRALMRSWDPVLSDLVEATGLSWSREVRALLLPGVAVALILLRTLLEDLLERRFAPKKPPPAAGAVGSTGTLIAQGAAPVTSTAFRPQGAAAGGAPGPGDAPPSKIGRYEILHELGHGAMGVVYKAQDPKIGRIVAIKTLSAAGQGAELEQYRARFLVEAKSAGRLNHPNIVAVHDVTDDEYGRPCLVLEFVEGTTLDRLVLEEQVPLGRLLELIAQVARALAFAHAHGIIHRDVKPANIMVTSATGQAKLSDFGIAKLEGTSMTIAGQVMGTPAFMSPEQCTGSGVDARSDIFSLGAVLYTLAAGEKPFPGDTFTTVAYKVVHTDPIPARTLNPTLPEELDAILMRCLAKGAADRYASADLLASDLENLRASLPGDDGAAAATAA